MRESVELTWPTPPAWAERALGEPLALLSDHAHCELGAAAAAQALIARNPGDAALVERLSALAVEELQHFRRVHRLLRERGGVLEPPRRNPYLDALQAAVSGSRGDAQLDRLLVAALIERRSLERFELLAAAASAGEPELHTLYAELGPSEAGHGVLFVELARDRFGREAANRRLAEVARREGEVVERLAFAPRIHSGVR